MRPIAASVATAVLIVLGSHAATADGQSRHEAYCETRADVLKALAGKYTERPVSIGLASNGAVVEVLASSEGTWTIIMTMPWGLSCLLAAGDHWEDLPGPVADVPM